MVICGTDAAVALCDADVIAAEVVTDEPMWKGDVENCTEPAGDTVPTREQASVATLAPRDPGGGTESTGLIGTGDVVELCSRCESSADRTSSETSCTAGRAPEELALKMPRDRADLEEPKSGSDRSEKEMAKEAADG